MDKVLGRRKKYMCSTVWPILLNVYHHLFIHTYTQKTETFVCDQNFCPLL